MKVALIGYGKMGKAIHSLADSNGFEVILAINSDNIEELTISNLKKADVAIEFSQPESALFNIKKCLEAGVPVISGTTGWLKHLGKIKEICRNNNGAFLYASNFSIGVNVFFALNEFLATKMATLPYQVSLEEIHHTQKLDAPSGTAITLANTIIEQMDGKDSWVNDATVEANKIPIISKRTDLVPGTHSISYQSEVDSIEIKHTAHSRMGFAKGAVLAARWMVGKKGIFTMKDVLGM